MKKRRLLASFLILGTLWVATQTNADDQKKKTKDGFRGYEWGTPLEQFDSLLTGDPIYDDGGEKWYLTSLEILAGAQVVCIFTFYENEFLGVGISTEGLTNTEKLFRALKAAYGEPEQEVPGIEEYTWTTKNTYRSYEINNISENALLNMWSNSLFLKLEEDKEKAAEKAVDEF